MMTNAPPARERLLRPREVADRLAVSATTIRRLVAAGEIEAVRVGGQLRLEAAAVEDYVQRHREGSVDPHHRDAARRALA